MIDLLEEQYPDAAPELDFDNAFELLVAVVLSAQCTDVRVNQVTKVLFMHYPDAKALAAANQAELEGIIKSCGLFRSKARNLIAAAKMLVETFGGEVPSTRQELMSLPGVGRKSANVITSCAMGSDAIAVDTHVFRVSRRIGLSDGETVLAVEQDLMAYTPQPKWSQLHHLLIFHGRRCCKARKPQCDECTVASFCLYERKKKKN
ncbi:endonuclease III [Desulfurispirillum indicum]|uniref:endonuclease III n=1 Tax=Desulfurispirillum indicum TaxID=936456 RepID=UPI003CCE31D2